MPSDRARTIPRGSIWFDKIGGLSRRIAVTQQRAETSPGGALLKPIYLVDLADVADPPAGVEAYLQFDGGEQYVWVIRAVLQAMTEQFITGAATIDFDTTVAEITGVTAGANYALTLPAITGGTIYPPYIELLVKDVTGALAPLVPGPGATVTLTCATGSTFEGGGTAIVFNAAYQKQRLYHRNSGVWFII